MSLINNFNQLDILVLLLTIVSMVYGYVRGLIKEILSILSIFISVYFSIILYPEISLSVKKYIEMALLADSISFAVLFLLIYSIVNIFNNFIVLSLSKTPLKFLDKNFGILFGFFRSLLIFSLLNILLTWIIWKNNIPFWVNEAKTMILIDYTSKKFVQILPNESLKKIEETFNLKIKPSNLNKLINKNKIEEYNEPVINKSTDKNSKGYSDNDNNSLDKLFNIESND